MLSCDDWMLKLRIKELAQQKGMRRPMDLAKKSGLSFSVAYKLWHDQQTRIDLKTIERLCKTFRVKPGQLFEYRLD